jgi:hypothetical protein
MVSKFSQLNFFTNNFFLTAVFGLLLVQFSFAQESPDKLKRFSHSEFIKKLISSKDSIFVLEDAFIFIDTDTDKNFYYEQTNDSSFDFLVKDTLIIDKQVVLKNVHFEHSLDDSGFALHHMVFKKPVAVENPASLVFSNCVFEDGIYIDVNMPLNSYIDYFEKEYENYANDLSLFESIVKNEFIIDVGTIEVFSPIFVTISKTIFHINPALESAFYANNIRAFDFLDNVCKGESFIYFSVDETWRSQFQYNDFGDANVILYQAGISSSSENIISGNIFRKAVLLEVENFNKTDVYNWNDWESKMISYQGYTTFINSVLREKSLKPNSYFDLFNNDSILNSYSQYDRFKLESSYKFEKRLIGTLHDFYKSQYDTDFANKTYVGLKDLETNRYNYLNKEDPTFKNYFTWKINQFLKNFSSYGTDPSKSVTISIYVIFLFAFIYLFFPNAWDTMNKNRLMKRIRFYTRYFRNKESMKDIYEEQKKADVMTFQEFKRYMQESEKETPKYFVWLAKPLYYFSSTNYKLIGRLFEKTDILKGKWVDLPRSKKISTSIIMGIWLLLLLVFDVFVKFLNALTLSINTFTTLGFGEIPTSGIPRYLCILQGFIGWFMLSIFSVALISQLLN